MNFKGFALSTDGFYHDSPVILGAKTLIKEEYKLPINGLTEIDRPPRQGMIRLGIKKKTTTGKEYPAEVDYFILDPETPEPEERQRLIDLFHAEFGNKPKAISCLVRSSDINEAFPQNYKRYGRNTALKCIGDGDTALCTDPQFITGLRALTDVELQDRNLKRDKARPIVHCLGRECMYAVVNEASTNKECKATATLSIEIPVLGGIGCWQITTGSFNSILNINGFIRDMVLRFGRAHMLPLTLERREIETIFKGKKAKHYPLYLNTHKSMGEMLKQLKIAPERVLIETYAEQSGELPPPAEIMDVEGAETEDMEIDRLAAKDAEVKHQGEQSSPGEPSKLPEPHPVEETVAKVVGEFDGKDVTVVKPEDQESKKFLDGLKEDGEQLKKPYDAAVEGEGYKKPPSEAAGTVAGVKEIDDEHKEEVPADVEALINALPSDFFNFMIGARKLLKAAEKDDMYIDVLHKFSAKVLSDIKDEKKQDAVMADICIVLEQQL